MESDGHFQTSHIPGVVSGTKPATPCMHTRSLPSLHIQYFVVGLIHTQPLFSSVVVYTPTYCMRDGSLNFEFSGFSVDVKQSRPSFGFTLPGDSDGGTRLTGSHTLDSVTSFRSFIDQQTNTRGLSMESAHQSSVISCKLLRASSQPFNSDLRRTMISYPYITG